MLGEHPDPVRLQKYLSQKGICSRRQAEDYIRAGRLSVNGQKSQLGDRVSPGDMIMLDDTVLDLPEEVPRVVLAFNKPKGVEVTLSPSAEGNKTLLDFDFGPQRVFPIGRLDKESHGLLLLTNDGELANQMMHPSFEKTKEYIVRLNKNIVQKDVATFESGLKINGKMTAPCQVETLPGNKVRIILKEGRNRQIRRMCGALGYEVLDLKRVRFGDVELGELGVEKFTRVGGE